MGNLESSDIEKLMGCCADIYRWDGEGSFGEHAVRVLPRLINAAVAAYQSFDFRTKSTELHLSDRKELIMQHEKAFYAHLHEHPLINYARESGATWSMRITDVQPWEEFQKTGLYNEFYKKVGLGHQMAASLPAREGDVVGLVYSKQDGDKNFTDRERKMLDMLRMHVLQAHHLSRKFAVVMGHARRMQGMLEALEDGVIALDEQLRVRQRTKKSTEILERHFGKMKSKELPETVIGWVKAQVTREKSAGRQLPRFAAMVETPGGGLKLRLAWRNGEWVLLIEEWGVRHRMTSEPLRSLGLTEREAEVLMWVSQGKSNPEIGIIVGAKPRTVQKHLERILRKLGVENRQAAGLRALELLL